MAMRMPVKAATPVPAQPHVSTDPRGMRILESPADTAALRRDFDRFDLKHAAIVEADRGQRLAPDAAGVDPEVARPDAQTERGPVPEHRRVRRPCALGKLKPRHASG